MGAWIKDETLIERRKFIDYIYGLIRYEIHKGEDCDKRLQVLSKIHYDLLYTENLEQANDWKKSVKGKDDITLAYEKIQKLTEELEGTKAQLADLLGGISNGSTKKDILELVDKVKKEVA